MSNIDQIPFAIRNPDIDQIEEQGWAFINVETASGKPGAPYTSHDYAESAEERYEDDTREVRIISW